MILPLTSLTIDMSMSRSCSLFLSESSKQVEYKMLEPPQPPSIFSCTAVPSSSLEGLPLGFVFTPLQHHWTLQLVDSDMCICTCCLSYLNLYCPFDEETGKWTCCFCYSSNVAPCSVFHPSASKSPLTSPDLGIMTNSIIEYNQPIKYNSSTDLNVRNDGESTAKVRKIIMVLIDGNLSSEEAKAVLVTLSSSFSSNTLFGLIIFTSFIHIYQVGVVGIASADVFPSPSLKNPNKNRFYVGQLKDALACASAYFSIDPNDCSNGRHFHEVHGDDDGLKTAPILMNNMRIKNSHKTRKEVLQAKRDARERKEKQLSESTTKIQEDTIRHQVHEKLVQNMEGIKSTRSASSRNQQRCTHEAIFMALQIITQQDYNQGRILIFTNGCSNSMGTDSITANKLSKSSKQTDENVSLVFDDPILMKSFHDIGRNAFEEGIGVDLFFSGVNSIMGAPTFLQVVEPSGGYVLSYNTFKEENFPLDLAHVVRKTFMSRVSRVAKKGVVRNVMNGCIVDVRMSRFLRPTQMSGPFFELNSEDGSGLYPNEQSSFAMGSSLAAMHNMTTSDHPSKESVQSTLTRLQMGRYDPLSTLGMMFQVRDVNELARQRFCYFQFVIRYVLDSACAVTTRVLSFRLPVTPSIATYLEGLNDSIISILLGREAVYRSMSLQDYRGRLGSLSRGIDECFLREQAMEDLDHTVHLVSKSFRRECSRIRSTNAEESHDAVLADFAFPLELASCAKFLHHLRRGPIMGPICQSTDERAIARDFFLRLPLEEMRTLIVPLVWRCYMSDGGEMIMEQLHPETMILIDSYILAIDTYSDILIWSGIKAIDHHFDRCREHCKSFLIQRSAQRFPSSRMYIINEGNSMARRLTARLAPSHDDSIDILLNHNPQIASLHPTEIQKTREKFRCHDSSDRSFSTWFWETVRDGSYAVQHGKSLCG